MYELNIDTYNPDIQLRCDFIRGKSISKMDDLLPIYTSILSDICPISVDQFDEVFDNRLAHILHYDTSDESQMKVIRNHRSENVTKILGLVYRYEGVTYLSKRTEKYLKDNDQPALFKSVCFLFQQPNGAQKIQTYKEKVDNGINIRPFHFIIKLLKIAYDNDIRLTDNDIYYYVLNCKQTLQGLVSPETVFERILTDRNSNIRKTVSLIKNYAWTFQHMREQLDYLKLANLIRFDRRSVFLNMREIETINAFIDELDQPLKFPCIYDLEKPNISKTVENDWLYYFGLSKFVDLSKFNTTAISFDVPSERQEESDIGGSTVELGDRGESFVMNYEKAVVGEFNRRLVNKVNYLGRTHGLGYDITSIEANRTENSDEKEMTRFIEVKTTARVTPPSEEFQDTINLTRNEWVAAAQQREHFYLYRLYFTNSGIFLHIIKNPYQKDKDGLIYVTPTQYRLEYSNNAVDNIVTFEEDGEE